MGFAPQSHRRLADSAFDFAQDDTARKGVNYFTVFQYRFIASFNCNA